MKSDVIRKRSRHDARRVGTGEPPSASPGASRRPSPVASQPQQRSPTLAPDSSTQSAYIYHEEYDFNTTSPQSELMGALGGDGTNGVYNSHGGYESVLAYSPFPGPYHPDYLQNMYSASDLFPFPGDTSGETNGGGEDRSNKRRRMSQDSMSEPPSSTTSYSSYADQSSVTTHSQRSSLDFPYNHYGLYAGTLRGSSQNAFWHPPMLPQEKSPQMFMHPPMLASDESPMDFLHPPMLPQDEADQLFATYLHPPMTVSDDSPMARINALHPHPPMFPGDTGYRGQDYYESNMVSFERNFGSGN